MDATHKKIVFPAKLRFSEDLWKLFEMVSKATCMTKTQLVKMAIQHELENRLKLLKSMGERLGERLKS